MHISRRRPVVEPVAAAAAAINESLRDERSTLAGDGWEKGWGAWGGGFLERSLENLPSHPAVDGKKNLFAESGC